MGCDIHIHAEIKIGGQWHHYDQPHCERDYTMFERMAGVRGALEKAIAPPRGLPEDATFITHFDSEYFGPDGHSHSWLSSAEIVLLRELDDERQIRHPYGRDWDGYLFGNSYSGFYKHPGDYPAGLEDFRFVFWFDN